MTETPTVEELCDQLRKRSNVIHIAVDAPVADDIQAILRRAANTLEMLLGERDEAREQCEVWREIAWREGYPKDSGDRLPWEPIGYIDGPGDMREKVKKLTAERNEARG